MSFETLPEAKELVPAPVANVLQVMGEIAVAHGVGQEDGFEEAAEDALAAIVAMSEEGALLSELIRSNLQAGYRSVVDRTDLLDTCLIELGESLGLDDIQQRRMVCAYITEASRILHEQASFTPSVSPAQADLPEEPTSGVLARGEEKHEKLADVPLSTDAQVDYMRRIREYPLLLPEEEVALAQAIEIGLAAEERLNTKIDTLTNLEKRELRYLIREGVRAKETMYISNLRLVASYARRYTHHGMDELDMIQEGNMGLLRAIEKFDYQKGFKFSTYATWWIKQAITRAIADQSRIIRLPVHIHEQLSVIGVARAKVEADLGRSLTDAELGEALDMSLTKIRQLYDYGKSVTSIHTPLGDDGTELGEIIQEQDGPDPTSTANDPYLQADIDKVLGTLSDDEARVLRIRAGMGYDRPHTLEETADMMDMTRLDVRKMESRAMKKLKGDQALLKRLSEQR